MERFRSGKGAKKPRSAKRGSPGSTERGFRLIAHQNYFLVSAAFLLMTSFSSAVRALALSKAAFALSRAVR